MECEQISIVHQDCIDGMKSIQDESIDLVIADPPYFKVVGEEWDYEWRTENDYISWCEKWVAEISRVAKRTATFYIFGYFHPLAMLLPIIEKYAFVFRQRIVIDKGKKACAGRHTSIYKMFPNCTEEVLFFVKDARPFVRSLLLAKQNEMGLTSKEINESLGVKTDGGGMWSFYSGDNILASIPTEEAWIKLQEILAIEIPYNQISFTFNVIMGLTDVWREINFYDRKREKTHSTQKPWKLIETLVLASSNPGDLVLDPFAGSGIVPNVCKIHGRRCISFEKDSKYYLHAKNRASQPSLMDFTGKRGEDI